VVHRVRAEAQPRHDAPARAVLRRGRNHGERLEVVVAAAAEHEQAGGRSRRSRPSNGAPRPRAATSTATSSSGRERSGPADDYVDINREDGLWAWMPASRSRNEGPRDPAQLEREQDDVPVTNAAGDPINLEYAETRSRFEPLIEMMQIKGNSEVHRWFWAADEFSNFENAIRSGTTAAATSRRSKQNWVRWGVTKGLAMRRRSASIPSATDSSAARTATTARRRTSTRTTSRRAATGRRRTVERRRTSEIGGWLKGKDSTPARSPVSGPPATRARRSGTR